MNRCCEILVHRPTSLTPRSRRLIVTAGMEHLAGRLRLEAAVPHLLRLFELDWDWYNETASEALARIGTSAMLAECEQYYVASDQWSQRLFVGGVFEDIRSEQSVAATLRLLEWEEDYDLRRHLLVGLSTQFDTDIIEPVRHAVLEDLEDPEMREAIDGIVVLAELVPDSFDFPEHQQWEEESNRSWNDFREKMYAPATLSILRRFASLIDQEDSPFDEDDDESDVDEIAGFFGHSESEKFSHHVPQKPIRIGPRVGRNDPCPCGSGKKYKKCCMREVAV